MGEKGVLSSNIMGEKRKKIKDQIRTALFVPLMKTVLSFIVAEKVPLAFLSDLALKTSTGATPRLVHVLVGPPYMPRSKYCT